MLCLFQVGQDIRGQSDAREHQDEEGGLPRSGLHTEAAKEGAPEVGDKVSEVP